MSASRIWVGAYTDDMSGSAEGIELLTVAEDGSLQNHGLAMAADSPSFLTRAGETLYAVAEGAARVSAFRISGDELRFLGTQDSAGAAPCSVAAVGRFLVATCYDDGVVDVHPIADDGSLGKTTQSLRGEGKGSRINQDGPHAHDVLLVDDTTVLTTDLGTDHIYVHTLEPDLLRRTGSVSLPSGSGPRDLVRHPSGLIWVLAELSGEIFVLSREAGEFAVVGSVALPGFTTGDHAAALALSDDGRFVYSGLRGSDQISVLAVSDDGATLTPVTAVGCGGGWPRHMVVDGGLLRVANQLTNNIVTFTIGDDGIPSKHSSLFVASPTYLLLD